MNKIKSFFNKKNITKREMTLVIIIMMVVLLFFSGYSIGKSIFETDINTTAQIAEPILIVDKKSPEVNITSTNNNGSYEFQIRNYDNEQNITQVDLQYSIEVISEVNDCVELKLYKDNERVEFENNKTKPIYIYKNRKEEHNYKLEIIYDENKNLNINEIMQDIQIKIHSEQIKI